MTSEKFCLRWNDFESHISGSLKDIRDARDFFDVTLVCEEEQLQAHKVIISACSPFFRNILQRNPHQHPLVYLKVFYYERVMGFCWNENVDWNPIQNLRPGSIVPSNGDICSQSNITPPYYYWSQCCYILSIPEMLFHNIVKSFCLLKLFPFSLTNQIQENR